MLPGRLPVARHPSGIRLIPIRSRAKPLESRIRAPCVFALRLIEYPMPTGSRDADVLLTWILDSMGLIGRRSAQWGGDEQQGALHRIVRGALLVDPLKGWDTRDLGDASGLSHTGTHHQMSKLRSCGLVSTEVDGKWHVHVLRGGSMSAAVGLVSVQARATLELRVSEMTGLVQPSENRMVVPAEEEDVGFAISIAEPGARREGHDAIDALVADLGLNGERSRDDDSLARDLLCELASSERPMTILALAERFSESRSRAQRAVERMRSAALVERVPMVDRISQDVYAGLMRQHSGRGEEWLMSPGGLGRLDELVSKALLAGAKKGSLNIEKVQAILAPVPIEDQRILLNTLGGRMPFGIRLAGANGAQVAERVMRQADRTLRRLRTVAQRLDEALEG